MKCTHSATRKWGAVALMAPVSSLCFQREDEGGPFGNPSSLFRSLGLQGLGLKCFRSCKALDVCVWMCVCVHVGLKVGANRV